MVTNASSRPLLPPAQFLASLVLMAALAFALPITVIPAWPWRAAGVIPIAAGVWLISPPTAHSRLAEHCQAVRAIFRAGDGRGFPHQPEPDVSRHGSDPRRDRDAARKPQLDLRR
jgi:hypothetical protein